MIVRLFKTLIVLVLFLNLLLPVHAQSQCDYFFNPSPYSSEMLDKALKEKILDMCWHFGDNNHFHFVSQNGEVYFEVVLGALPDRENGKFIELGQTEQYAFSYKIQRDGSEEFNVLQAGQKKAHPDEYSYIVTDRRIFESATPKLLNENELEAIIRNKNILFYTGAGLSLASNVPAMNELYALLGLEEGEGFLPSLEKAWNHPKEFSSKILTFHKACFSSSPTSAHLALKDLALFKNIRIITENLDCLHERSGIDPYRINAKQLREEIGGASLSQFDYIVCVGLSFDDRGFLGWYKEQNPKGKIVAVDLKQPSYLGDEDYLVVGNLQEIFPEIKKKLLP